MLLILWRLSPDPPSPGDPSFDRILTLIKQTFPDFQYTTITERLPSSPPESVENLYRHYLRFLQQRLSPRQWVHVKEFLHWSTLSGQISRALIGWRMKPEDVLDAMNVLLSYNPNDDGPKIITEDLQRILDVCKPFFQSDDLINLNFDSDYDFNRFVNLMRADKSFANEVGYDSAAAVQRLAVACLSALSVELFDDIDNKATTLSNSSFNGSFFACYSAIYWPNHLETAVNMHLSYEIVQAVEKMLSKFERRYTDTRAERDLSRWCSYTLRAFNAGVAGTLDKSDREPLALRLLNALKARYHAVRDQSSLTDWLNCARQGENHYANFSQPLAYVRHLEQALIEVHTKYPGHKNLVELTNLYEKWERQFPEMLSSRYSLAYKEWLNPKKDEHVTGCFSVGLRGQNELEAQIHVQYPWALMTLMLDHGGDLRKNLRELPGAYVSIGLDMLHPEIQTKSEEDRKLFNGGKPKTYILTNF
jgi:hypothetical protein